MLDLLWIPISFFGALALYLLFLRRFSDRTNKAIDHDHGFAVGLSFMDVITTNNSYDPMGDVLSELDRDEVQSILGGPLNVSMRGYMQ